MNLRKRVNLLVVLLCFITLSSLAQGSRSPYTNLGIGDIQKGALMNNAGMGMKGTANGSFLFLNTANPALLPLNNIFTFEFGGFVETRTIQQDTLSEDYVSGTFSHIAFGLPIIPSKWTMSFGLNPYSTINHRVQKVGELAGSPFQVLNDTELTGGITEVYISNGVRINKYVSLGIKASYLFGSRLEETETRLLNENSPISNVSTRFYDRVTYSDVNLTGAAAFTIPLENQKQIIIAGTYSFDAEVNTNKFSKLDQIRGTDGVVLSSDTILTRQPGYFKLPSSMSIGATFSKRLNYLVGVEYHLSDWSQYATENLAAGSLARSSTFSVGGEYTPNAAALNNYLLQMTYRAGFSYENTPYIVNGKQIKEVGINFGISAPLRFNNLSLSMKVGSRGNTSGNMISERFFRIGLGITVGDESWFYRSRFN